MTSVRAWTFVVHPPRERPIACAERLAKLLRLKPLIEFEPLLGIRRIASKRDKITSP